MDSSAAKSNDAASVARLLRPRSVAVVGASADPGAVGGRVLAHLRAFGFAGEIHLVNPNRTEIDGLPCVGTIDALPFGVDAVVLAIPEAAIKGALDACVRRRAGAAVIFASGFAEMGAAGEAAQREIAAIARAGGLALVGPNCMGLANYVDRVPLSFGPTEAPSFAGGPAVGVIAQSGGIAGHIRVALHTRGVDVSYAISTGNEAGLGVEDFLGWLVDDDATRAIAIFAEQLRNPRRFLEIASRARRIGKPIVMLHTGRSARAREAARTHTGALTGDHAIMRVQAAAEAVVVASSLEELVDVAEFLVRFPAGADAGPAIVTDSGAFKSFALDYCDGLGLDLPPVSPATGAALGRVLPPFVTASNPLDITTQGLKAMELYEATSRALLDDPGIGGLIAAILPGTPAIGLAKGEALARALAGSSKPVAVVAMGGDYPVADALVALLRRNAIPFLRSPERAMAAMAQLVAYGAARHRRSSGAVAVPPIELPARGVLSEHQSKAILAAAGIPIPQGHLARDLAAAESAAAQIGYPVALKAQAATLAHKSDVGGVVLNVGDPQALRAAWTRLHGNLAAARPDLVLDGVLVEAMARTGLEMVVGARRDRDWGPVLMVGLGGIWVEALGDIRLMPVDVDEAQVIAELRHLKAAPLLDGARGAPPADLRALAKVVTRIGAIMRAAPQIMEIDINPVTVYADGDGDGDGAVALDALIATG